jgi:hypothetical protein
MPPRYAYWTILIDSAPTAFRAREKDELLPTFNQLRRTNKDVVLKWFTRGKLWDTPEAADAARHVPVEPREKRGHDWRPGGMHKDPRDRFKKGGNRRHESARAPAAVSRSGDQTWRDRPQGATPHGPQQPWRDKPRGTPPHGPQQPWRDKPRGTSPRGPQRPWRDKPHGAAPRGPQRPWRDKPRGAPPRGPQQPWREKPRGAATPPSSAAAEPRKIKPDSPDGTLPPKVR